MTITQLKYLIRISKLKSFSKASEELGVTQPALTLQIKNLEDEVGFKMFNRTQKPLTVTREGELFIKKASSILKQLDDLQDIAIELEEEINGVLTIGIIPTIAPYLTPIFIDDLNKTYPNLQLSITEIITEDIIEAVKDGEIDLGIIATPVEASGVVFEKLFYEKFYLFVSDKNTLLETDVVRIKDLELNELWYLNEGNCFQNQINALCKISSKVIENQNFKYQSNSIESLRYIVEHRGGMTFIPELATLTIPSEKEDMVKEISGIQPVREISTVTAKFVAKQKLIDAFTEVVLRNIPARMKEMSSNMILDTQITIS